MSAAVSLTKPAEVERCRCGCGKPRGKCGRNADNLIKFRLPDSEIRILRWVFTDLEGMMGLQSNMGAQIEQLQAQPRDDYELWKLEPGECGPSVPLALRMDPPLMHVKSTLPVKRALDMPVEGWACWSNHGESEGGKQYLGTEVRRARDALLDLVEAGDARHVVVLAQMYSLEPEGKSDPSMKPELGPDGKPLPPEPPPWRWTRDFPALGDLVVLAQMTPTVLAHSAKLTREARENEHMGRFERGARGEGPAIAMSDAQRHVDESRLEVTPLGALYDLLLVRSGESKERRAAKKEAAETVRREAHELLIAASKAYRAAKAEPC